MGRKEGAAETRKYTPHLHGKPRAVMRDVIRDMWLGGANEVSRQGRGWVEWALKLPEVCSGACP